MADAAERLEFEQAAGLRDRLKALAHITSHQGINVTSVDDADVVGARPGRRPGVRAGLLLPGRAQLRQSGVLSEPRP